MAAVSQTLGTRPRDARGGFLFQSLRHERPVFGTILVCDASLPTAGVVASGQRRSSNDRRHGTFPNATVEEWA